MLLSDKWRMKKRKEKKPMKKRDFGEKMLNSSNIVQTKNGVSSDTSNDSVFDASEFELVAKQNFSEPTIRPPSSELLKRGEKGTKKKDERKKVQAQSLQKVECAGGLKADPKRTNGCQDDENRLKAGKNKFLTSSGVSQKVNLEAPNPKKKKKKKKKHECPDSISGPSSVQDSVPQNVKQPVSVGTSSSRKAATVGVREKKLGKKRKIADIFEEAEICMEEAVPKKIDEVRKLLMKGTKSVADKKEKGAPKKKPDYEDLSFKKSRVEVDAALLETTGEGISSGLTGARKILDKVDAVLSTKDTNLSGQKSKIPDIDPNKFIPVKTQKLRTGLPDFEEGGDSESDEDEEQEQRRMNLMEAFADDDIADEFRKEKEEAEEESKPKTVDLRLPGWGSWGGLGIEPKNNKKWNKNVLRFPGVPRKDQGKKRVIIHDEPPLNFKKQQVNDLPPEFPSVAAYEASIRAPIGTTWVPQLAHNALVAAPVVAKMGSIIQPLDESHLIKQNAEEEAQKKLSDSIKPGRPARPAYVERKQKPCARVKHGEKKPAVLWDHARSEKLSQSIRKEKIIHKQKS